MHLLATGGAGYVGSVAVEHLLAAGHTVVVFDNLSMGHREAVPEGAELVVGDLANPEQIDEVFRAHRFDAVMHFAAHAHVGESFEKPMLYLGDNVVNGANLLSAVTRHQVPKFVLSSTANLFANPSQMPIPETEPICPSSPYGESKAILERMLSWLETANNLRFAILRYFNAAGATVERGQDHNPERRIIPLVLQCAAGQRDHFTIYGEDYPTPDGSCIRDYVHIADLATAHLAALEALDDGSRIYHLGTGCGFSVKEVVAAVEKVTGKSITLASGPRRPGDPAELVADNQLIGKELGWTPRFTDLAEIIESDWQWRQRFPHGYGG